MNKSTRTHNQEDALKNPKHQYSLNNKTTKEETINQHKEDNTLGLDENTLNQYNERIICNGSDNEFESNNNNESSTRSRAPIENIFQPYKDQEGNSKRGGYNHRTEVKDAVGTYKDIGNTIMT